MNDILGILKGCEPGIHRLLRVPVGPVGDHVVEDLF